MNTAVKLFSVVLCLSLCIVGAMVAPARPNKGQPPTSRVTPVMNRKAQQRIWIEI
jgi:hypothetical protein